MPKNRTRAAIVSAGSPKRLRGEDGENFPAFVTLRGRPIIAYVLEAACRSSLEYLYVWSNPESTAELERIVADLDTCDTRIRILPADANLFDSMTRVIREEYTPDLFDSGPFRDWQSLMQFAESRPDVREEALLHIPSDTPLITAAEIDRHLGDFDDGQVDYSLGVTDRVRVEGRLGALGLWDEFTALGSPNSNFVRIFDGSRQEYISTRINNLHLFKPFYLDQPKYDLFQRIFDQRMVSKMRKWFSLASLIQGVFGLPWLKDVARRKRLYRTIWHLLLSQQSLPAFMWRRYSRFISVAVLEDNIGFLMGLRMCLHLDGDVGAYLDADTQEEFDFLAKHFDALYVGSEGSVSVPDAAEDKTLGQPVRS